MKFKISKRLFVLSVLLIILIAVSIWIVYLGGDDKLSKSDINNVQSASKKILKVEINDEKIDKKIKPKKIEKLKVNNIQTKKESDRKNIDAMIDMMYQSSIDGDDRSPPVDENTVEKARLWIPDEHTIQNPEEYEKKQKESAKSQVLMIHDVFDARINSIEDNIKKAESEHSRNFEEIKLAKEAVEEMKKVQKELDIIHTN